MMDEQQTRLECLRLAQDIEWEKHAHLDIETVVRRALAYADFVLGKKCDGASEELPPAEVIRRIVEAADNV